MGFCMHISGVTCDNCRPKLACEPAHPIPTGIAFFGRLALTRSPADDLLAACEAAERVFELIGCKEFIADCPACQEAAPARAAIRAAIARARGAP